jgi:membrane-associated HD superfamily phosphohydrolase
VRPLVLIYWTRLALSIVAAAISTLVATMLDASAISTFMNGLTIALLIYLLSYSVLKAKFLKKVEKQSKIMTMGIFIYFISWAVFFILFYTILKGPALVA